MKLLYLAIQNACIHWRRPIEWTAAMGQFGECREFRVRAVIMGRKECQYVPTQRACDTE